MKHYPTWAEINLDNILYNFKKLKSLTKEGTKACAIIKANGYGHGSVMLAKHLEKNGCDYFGVATANEALELRKHGIKTNIMCLAYIEEQLFEDIIKNDIDVPVFSYDVALKASEVAKKLDKKVNIQIKLDTGMSRVGFQFEEKTIEEIEKISKLDNIVLQGIFTHFAMADTYDRSFTVLQFSRYKEIVDSLEKKGIRFNIKHVCNSAGIISYPEYHLDMVRMGISLYGHYPSNEVDKKIVDLRPAMTLKTKLTNVKKVEKNSGVSYGHKYILDKDEIIATMPIGYADGFTRMLSSKADVFINGKKFDVVGRICMDQSMVKVDNNTKIGDIVIIFGEKEEERIERFEERLGTINYELLCMVQRRIPRVYFVEGKEIETVNYLLD